MLARVSAGGRDCNEFSGVLSGLFRWHKIQIDGASDSVPYFVQFVENVEMTGFQVLLLFACSTLHLFGNTI